MDKIKLYFAGDWSGVESSDRTKITYGVQNRLVSYAYPNLFEKWMEIAKNEKGNIIIDSGAFSAWNKGAAINIEDYIEYCKKSLALTDADKSIHIVNLDVIPGSVGTTKSLQNYTNPKNKVLIEHAAKEGYNNLKKFKNNGITPIHVFHQGEDLKWLDRMCNLTDYIGVSPANDMSKESKLKWIDFVFNYLAKNSIKVNTHGFAVASPDVLLQYPWTSCDAASWRLSAAMGSIYYPLQGFDSDDYTKFQVIYISDEKGNKISKKVISLLSKDGYSIKDLQTFGSRAMFNIKYFLGLEKCINIKKSKTEFTIKNTLL